MSRLTAKQDLFAHEVAAGKTKSAAYRTAYDTSRMTAKTVNERASWTAKQNKVRARIKSLATHADARIEAQFDLTIDRIAQELCKVAFFDPGQLFDKRGKFVPINKLPPEIRAAIASVELSTNADGRPVQKITLWNKRAALDSLAKWKGMFIERKVIVHSPISSLPPEVQRQVKDILDELIAESGASENAAPSGAPRVTH